MLCHSGARFPFISITVLPALLRCEAEYGEIRAHRHAHARYGRNWYLTADSFFKTVIAVL